MACGGSGASIRCPFVTLAWPVSGCFPDVAITDTDLLLSCDPSADNDSVCPPDFTCKAIAGEGQCIANSVLTRTPIELSEALTVSAPRFSIQPEHNALRVSFALSEQPAFVEVKAGGRNLICDSSGSGPVTFTCDTTIDLTFDDGPNIAIVSARDAAGNTVSSEARFVVDQDAPLLSVVSAITSANPAPPPTTIGSSREDAGVVRRRRRRRRRAPTLRAPTTPFAIASSSLAA
jgi:hypothetical protein